MRGTLLVGLVLSFVTMLSVLSVPLMINPNSPTMVTVDVAYRINTFADYAVANALCLLSLILAAGGAWFYLHHAVEKVKTRVSALSLPALPSPLRSVLRAILLALFAFAIFGPLLNLLLWAFAEKWYFPNKLPLEFGLTFWYRVFQPRGNALASLGTSVWIAFLTVVLSLAVAVPAGYALGTAQASLAQRDPARVPAAAGGAEPARVREHRAGVLPDRPERNDSRRRARACLAWPGARGVDRLGGVRVGRCLARGGVAQPGCVAVDVLSHGDAAARGAGLIASAIFVFLESLDEFTGTYFVGVPDVTTLPLLMFNASMGGNYQIASITALLLLIPVDRLHAGGRALPQGGCAGDGGALA